MFREYNSVYSSSSFSSLSEDDGKSFQDYHSSKPPILPIGQSLKTLHLPPSIDSIDNLSSGLWNWIHSQDFISQESANDLTTLQGSGTKVIFNSEKVVNGKLIKNKHVIMDNQENASLFEIVGKNVKARNSYKSPLPRPLPPKRKSNLDSLQSIRGSDATFYRSMLGSKSSSVLSGSLLSIATRDEPYFNSSVFLQAVALQGKFSSKLTAIYCVVEVGKRKYCTDPIKIEKNSTVVDIREGFIFDVPSANFTAVIKVYGIYQPQKSVFSTLTKSFGRRTPLAIRRSNETLTNSMDFNQMQNPFVGTEIYLGEVSFQLTNIKFSKLTGVYPLVVSSSSSITSNHSTSSKILKNLKNIKPNNKVSKSPSIVVQMGIYNEGQATIDPPKVPSDIKNINLEYGNYISFLINSNQKSIWRRYWAQILNNYLYIYNEEYKNKKSPISRLNLGYIKSIGKTDPDQVYVNNGITFEFEKDYLSSETGEELINNAKSIPLQFEFINGNEILVEDTVQYNESWSNWNLSTINDEFKIYCYADSKNEVAEWIEAVNRAKDI